MAVNIGVNIQRSANRIAQAVRESAVGGAYPDLLIDVDDAYFRANGGSKAFSEVVTHSRSGNATMVDSDGLLKWAPHNLITYSEAFDNADWTEVSGRSIVTPNDTSAPDGSVTGDRFTNTSDVAVPIYQIPSITGIQHTLGVWLKAGTGTWACLRFAASEAAWFNLSTGQKGSEVNVTSTITADGDWYYCTITGTPSADFAILHPVTEADLSLDGVDNAYAYIWGAHLYRSDLGGMVDNPDQPASLASYVPTTSSAVYLPRRGHHVYNGSAWVNEGLLHESEARTNLLLNSGTLATQNVTVTAVPHTLHFTGTGTVTLLGVSTAGPLVGTGTGENNRVSLTFTPIAGILTLTVSGTVTNAQIEAAPTPSSYIPTAGATVTRAAETLTIPSANLPYSSTAMSIQMDGRVTYADEATPAQSEFVKWYLDSSNSIRYFLRTDGAFTGTLRLSQAASGVSDTVDSSDVYAPDILVPFNIAGRHGSTFVNGAVDGVALTANTTPTALPDLSSTDLSLGHTYMGTIKTFRIWDKDLGDTGIEEATAPSLEPSLELVFDGSESSFVVLDWEQ